MKDKQLKVKKTFGTHEYSDKTINFITGCIHDCFYCYGKSNGGRFKKFTPDEWKNEKVRQHDLNKRIPKYNGVVMFPSSHDITPEHLSESITMLDHILKSGNSVLVVSKPHIECIKKICDTFTEYKDKIKFRFTIGSTNSNILKYWEPFAPDFNERLACLQLCHGLGFQTSVSCEPLLQKNVDDIINQLSPYVTDTIWIGKPNQLLARTKMNGHGDPETIQKCNDLMSWIDDPKFIMDLYTRYKDNPMIRWKESFRNHITKLLK